MTFFTRMQLLSRMGYIFQIVQFFCFLSVALVGIFPELVYAERHIDVAPISDDVVQEILHDRQNININNLPNILRGHLDEVETLINEIDQSDQSITGQHARSQIRGRRSGSKAMLLESKAQELNVLRGEILARLNETRAKLVSLGLTDKTREWDAYIAQVTQRFSQLNSSLDEIRAGGNSESRHQALERSHRLLYNIHGRIKNQEHVPEKTKKMPTFRMTVPTSRVPKINRKVSPPQYISSQRAEPVMLAALDGFLLAEALPTPEEAASCNYTAEDLGESQEVKLTQEIYDLAEKLDYSAVKIYQYVTNEIEFEPYFGSLKGATGALVTGKANATDQASLLIALLRASNIPARYVQGSIGVETKRLKQWVGTRTLTAAINVLTNGKIPASEFSSYTSGSVIGAQIVHVWVEACIPYANYRGTRIDLNGHRWLALDPSFALKNYTVGLQPNVSFDYTNYLSSLKDELPHEKYLEEVETAIKADDPNNSLSDVGYIGTDIPTEIDVLPASLPYEVLGFAPWGDTTSSETAILPDSHRYKFKITVNNSSGTELLTTTLSYPDVLLQRITLSYKAATVEDQALLDAWDGDLGNLPSSIVNVVPVIKVDGVDNAIGSVSIVLGTQHNLVMKLTLADENRLGACPLDELDTTCINMVEYTTIKAGGYHALQVDAYHTSDRLLESRNEQLLNSVNNTPDDVDATQGEFLHLSLLKYYRYIADATQIVGRMNNSSGRMGNTIGLTSSDMKVQYLFDLPYAVFPGALLIDVAGGLFASVDINTGNQLWKNLKMWGYTASAYEHYVWQENARLEAVSTVRGLQYANENGITIRTLDTSNIADYDTLMDADMQPFKASITDLVNSGYIVKVPRQMITFSVSGQDVSWTGAVYMAENSQSTPNAIGAIISGGFGGGYAFTKMFPRTELWKLPAPKIDYIFNSTTANIGSNSYIVSGGDPVNMVNGNMYHKESDIAIKGRGMPIVFERFYNALEPKDGPLGFGWTHSLNHSLVLEDDNYDGIDNAADTDGVISAVSWIDGTGGKKYYKVTASTNGQPNGFENAPGIFVDLTRTGDSIYTIREKNGISYTFQFDSVAIDQKAKLVSISDRNNNTLTLNYNASNELVTVVDDLDRALTFTYTNGRITNIQDWSGRNYQYAYNQTTGDLVSFSNPRAVAGQQAPVTYEYYTAADGIKLNHALKRYILPRGNSMMFEYYSNGKVFRHTDTSGESMTFTYNEFRGEATTTNARGFVSKYYFDDNGNMVRQVKEGGGEERFTYDDPDQPMNRTSKRDLMGYVTTYEYDANGNVTRTTNPSGSTIEYSYFNAFNKHGKVKDANGVYTLYKYDANGNLLETIKLKKGIGASIDPNSYVPQASEIVAWTINTYDAYGNRLTSKAVRDFTTREGPTTEYDYTDTSNNVAGLNAVSVTRCGDQNADGVISRASECDSAASTYDNLGRERSGIDNAWYPIQREYDELDRIYRGTDSIGNLRDYKFDDNNNPIEETLTVTVDGVSTNLDQSLTTYDQSDRTDTTVSAGGFVTYYQYDESGNVVKFTNPDNYSVSFEYDADNRVVKAFDQEGHFVSRKLDISGRPVSVTDPNGNSTRYEYYGPSKDGRLYRQYDAVGRFVEFDYDNNGNVTKVSDNLTPLDPNRTTLTNYDELNRAVRIAGPGYTDVVLGAIRPVTKYVYDNLGNLKEVHAGYTDISGTNAASDVVSLQESTVYDDFGRLRSKTDALGKSWSYDYDIHGNVTKITDPKNQIVERTYYPNGLLETQTVSAYPGDPSPLVTRYIRNRLGQVTEVQAPEVNYTYDYDVAHRLVKVTDGRAAKSLSYDLSPGGLLNSTLDSDNNETDYLYDPVGRLIGMWAPNGDLVSFVRDAGGRLTEKIFTNGVNTRYTYNADDSLSRVINRKTNGNVVSRHDYTYDDAGNRDTHIERIAGVRQEYKYLYDSLNRLIEVQNNADGTVIESYAYDPFSNRRSKTNASGTVAYVYDDAQQLKEIRQDTTTGAVLASFSYDDNGNMLQKVEGATTLTLVYDALDRLEQADKTGLDTETYRYDHQGRRINKTVGSATTQYVYAGSNIRAEYGSDWTTATAQYTHGPGTDAPLLRTAGGEVRYYHGDGLGSIVAVSNAAGNNRGTARYDAFGNVTENTGSIPQYGYTGREPDATGLIYYRARYYDPTIGRFTQRDPKGFIDGINRYAYAVNNPVNYRDPRGANVSSPASLSSITSTASYFDSGNMGGGMAGGGFSLGSNMNYGQQEILRATIAYEETGGLSAKLPGSTSAGSSSAMEMALGFIPGYDLLQAVNNENATFVDYAVGILGIFPGEGKIISLGVRGVAKEGVEAAARSVAKGGDDIVQQVAKQQYQAGFQHLRQFMSPKEINAYLADPSKGQRFMGTAVHRATEASLQKLHPGRFNYNATRPYDFIDKVTGQAIELTTKKGVKTHINRGADIVTYD